MHHKDSSPQAENDENGVTKNSRGDDAGISTVVGLRVREARKRAALTQDAAAAAARISLPYYRQLERGEARWNVDHLEAVARALNVDPRDLLPGPAEGEAAAGGGPVLTEAENALLEAVRAGDAPAAAAAAVVAAQARPAPAPGATRRKLERLLDPKRMAPGEPPHPAPRAADPATAEDEDDRDLA